MKKLFRMSFLALGIVLLFAAGMLHWLTQQEEDVARTSSLYVVEELQASIAPQEEESTRDTIALDGSYYIGILSIPQIELTLPVAAAYSYEQLDKTPCVYTGSVEMKNLIIAAHNYKAHFGNIDALAYGDVISFVDVNGAEHSYMLTKEETIDENDFISLYGGDWELTLFTCVYGNNSQRLLLRFIEMDI